MTALTTISLWGSTRDPITPRVTVNHPDDLTVRTAHITDVGGLTFSIWSERGAADARALGQALIDAADRLDPQSGVPCQSCDMDATADVRCTIDGDRAAVCGACALLVADHDSICLCDDLLCPMGRQSKAVAA